MTHPDHLASGDAANLARLLDASPRLAAAAGHVRSLAGMMTRRQGLPAPEDCLTQVEAGDQPQLHSFASGIRRDQQAVTTGLALPHSSGALQGKNCTIKYLKQLMYARANFDLLRKMSLLNRTHHRTWPLPTKCARARNVGQNRSSTAVVRGGWPRPHPADVDVRDS
jgi:hypothetical protein